jgi:uncharacterized membrane protein
MNKYLKEIILWVLILIPLVYLATVWKTLPAQVPSHFDFEGNVNGWTNKPDLIWLILGLGLGTYILMLFIPRFDPKKKIEQMGEKYYSMRLLMGVFMSLISLYILYAGNAGKVNSFLLIGLVGGLYAVLGNYMQALKPNYFIGFRTPWTLENEDTWKRTHRLAGRLWMIGGLIIIIISWLATNSSFLGISFGVITAIIAIIPYIYSYLQYSKNHASK